MNPRRGHESPLHLEAKTAIGRLFDDPAWSVFYEQHDADILVMHIASQFMAAIEAESSPRNVIRNIGRDFSNGCHAVAVVSLTERYCGQITGKILGHVENHDHIRVFLFNAQGRHELRNWIENLAGIHGSNKGGTP